MKIFISNSAYNDLEDITEYYKNEGVAHIGEQFVREIIEHVETLTNNPDIGRVVPEFSEENIRELIHPPFRIVYLRETKAVHVIRVWRSERILKLPDENKTNNSNSSN